MKITITERADWQPPGLTVDGEAEVACEQIADGVSEQTLLGWAYDELGGVVVGELPSWAGVSAAAHAFDWPSVFKEGDVVRTLDGRTIGVVLAIAGGGSDDEPLYDLHIDSATDGVQIGIGVWEPWLFRVANDAASLEEAHRLGLGGT